MKGKFFGKARRNKAKRLVRRLWMRRSVYKILQNRATLAADTGLHEICGTFVCREGGEIRLNYLQNRCPEPLSHSMNMFELEVSVRGARVFGTFHTHPISGAHPSKTDFNLRNISPFLIIYADIKDEIAFWDISDPEDAKRYSILVR